MKPKVIVICGLPLTGKSTIAQAVSQKTGIRYIDIDTNIRFPIFGPAPENAHDNKESGDEMRAQMLFSYEILCRSVGILLSRKKSVIATATFSKEHYRKLLFDAIAPHHNTTLKMILCSIQGCLAEQEQEEVARRIALRNTNEQYVGGCKTVEHYFRDKEIFHPLEYPHLFLDTFFHPVDSCVILALDYIK